MGIFEAISDEVISETLQEAVDEVTGRSRRKWAIALIAFVLGGVCVAVIVRKRRQAAQDGSPGTVVDEELAVPTTG